MSFYYTEMLKLQTNLRANVVSVCIKITEKICILKMKISFKQYEQFISRNVTIALHLRCLSPHSQECKLQSLLFVLQHLSLLLCC